MANNRKLLLLPISLACIVAATLLSTCDKVDDNCGGKTSYDPLTQFCVGDAAYPLCGGLTYNPLTETCRENVVVTECENGTFVRVGEECGVSYSLNVSVTPTDSAGTVRIVPKQDFYLPGDEVALYAEAKEGYSFSGWSGAVDIPGNPALLKMDGDKTIVAMFRVNTHTLTVSASSSEHGSVSQGKSTGIAEDEAVEISAVANTGYVFDSWMVLSGEATIVDSSSASTTVNLTADASIVAIFVDKELRPDIYTLIVNRNPAIGGTTVPESSKPGIISGQPEMIRAIAADGYKFKNWEVVADGKASFSNERDENTMVTLRSDATITANFGRVYTVKFDMNGGASSTISDVTVDDGGTIGSSFPANPTKKGHYFDGWYSGTVQYTDSTKIVSDVTLIARWAMGLVDDRDGTVYRAVKIGDQVWMAENLNFRILGESSQCNNTVSNCNIYGRLYIWDAARNACPVGWHLPDTAEWRKLVAYAGGVDSAGKKLKSEGGWIRPDQDGRNNGSDAYGFSALPGGYYYYNESTDKMIYDSPGGYGIWWSATEVSSTGHAYARRMGAQFDDDNNVKNFDYVEEWGYPKSFAMSVRCVLDND